MKNDPNLCQAVQEQIAWGRAMDAEFQAHALDCATCRDLAFEYAELDSRVAPLIGAPIPLGFADRVMNNLPTTQKRDSRTPVSPNQSGSSPFASWRESILKLGLASAWIALASLVFVPLAAGESHPHQASRNPELAPCSGD